MIGRIWDAWGYTADAYLPDRGITDEELMSRLDVEELHVIKKDNMTCVVVSEGNKLIVSFAGSNDIQDWLANVRAIGQADYCGSYVGDGFLENYNKVREELIYICSETNKKICIYGHSAGGAAAYLHADALNREGIAWYELITFESPRVFSDSLAKQFDSRILGRTCLRVTHGADFVPHVPFGIRFSHVGTEVWFPRTVEKRMIVNPSIWRRTWQTLRAIRLWQSGMDHMCDRIGPRIAFEKFYSEENN